LADRWRHVTGDQERGEQLWGWGIYVRLDRYRERIQQADGVELK
jgi:hypothetical protein